MTQRAMGIALLLVLAVGLWAQVDTLFVADSTAADTTLVNLGFLFAPDSTATEPLEVGTQAPAINLFRYIFGLLVVCGLLAVLWWVVRKYTGQGATLRRSHGNAHILETFSLNTRQSLYLVRLLDAVYVLGVSTERIELLDKITDPATVQRLSESDKPAAEQPRFASVLDKFRKQP